jgi:hypothetical protein
VSAEMQHPLPGDGSADGPGRPVPGAPASSAPGLSASSAPGHPASLAATPPTGIQDLDKILDWELEAPPREDDPYRSYCEESEPREEEEEEEEEWLEESYLLAAPGTPGPERFAAGGTADAMVPAQRGAAAGPGKGNGCGSPRRHAR